MSHCILVWGNSYYPFSEWARLPKPDWGLVHIYKVPVFNICSQHTYPPLLFFTRPSRTDDKHRIAHRAETVCLGLMIRWWREFLPFLVSRATEGAWPCKMDMALWKLLPQLRRFHILFLPCYSGLSPHLTEMAAAQQQLISMSPQSCILESLGSCPGCLRILDPQREPGIYYFPPALTQLLIKNKPIVFGREGKISASIEYSVPRFCDSHTRL